MLLFGHCGTYPIHSLDQRHFAARCLLPPRLQEAAPRRRRRQLLPAGRGAGQLRGGGAQLRQGVRSAGRAKARLKHTNWFALLRKF